MPAALSESDFITSPYEGSLLRDPDFRGLLAQAHANGICQHLGGWGAQPEDTKQPQIQPLDSDMGRAEAGGCHPGRPSLFGPSFSDDGTRLVFGVSGCARASEADLANFEIWPAKVLRAAAREIVIASQTYSGAKLSPAQDKVLVTTNDYDGSSLLVIDFQTKQRFNLSLLGV